MNHKKPGLWLNSAEYEPMWKRYNQAERREKHQQPWWFYWLVGIVHGTLIGIMIGAALWASTML